MKTRRGFLTALGLGAGASMLGLPGMAHALGGRWRRARGCSNECGCPSACECASVKPYTTTTTMTSCACACPISLYAQSGTTYYYYCLCCGDGNVWSPSTQLISNLPIPCSDQTHCIGSGCARPIPEYKRSSTPPNVFAGYHLDPDATYKDAHGNVQHHIAAFLDGVAAPKPKDLQVDPGPRVTATKIAGVTYKDKGKDRYAVLYDFSRLSFPTLRVGFAVSEPPDSPTSPDNVSVPNVNLGHCHLVYFNGSAYLVATAK